MKRWWIAIPALFVCVWVFHTNDWMFVQDPHAQQLLSHKHLPVHFHKQVWEYVLRLHVVSSSVAMVSGGIGLLRTSFPRLSRIHRGNGWVYLVSVCLGALTAGYLAPNATGGELSSFAFNAMEAIWVGSTAWAILRIRRGRLQLHKVWMIRSYSLALANLAIHLWLLVTHSLLHLPYNTAYITSVWLSGGLNLLAAEALMRWTSLLMERRGRTTDTVRRK